MAWTNNIDQQGMRAAIIIFSDLFGPVSDKEKVKRLLDCSPSTVGKLKRGSDEVSLDIALKIKIRLEILGISFNTGHGLMVNFSLIDRSKRSYGGLNNE